MNVVRHARCRFVAIITVVFCRMARSLWAYHALLFGLSYYDYAVAGGITSQGVLTASALLLATYR